MIAYKAYINRTQVLREVTQRTKAVRRNSNIGDIWTSSISVQYGFTCTRNPQKPTKGELEMYSDGTLMALFLRLKRHHRLIMFKASLVKNAEIIAIPLKFTAFSRSHETCCRHHGPVCKKKDEGHRLNTNTSRKSRNKYNSQRYCKRTIMNKLEAASARGMPTEVITS